MSGHITVLLNTIFANYFNNAHCVFVVMNQTAPFELFTIPVVTFDISEDFHNVSSGDVCRSNNVSRSIVDFKHYCQGFVVFVQYPICVLDIIEKQMYTDIKSPFKFNQRKYVFILDEYNIKSDEIYQSNYLQQIPNILFIIKNRKKSQMDLAWHQESRLSYYEIFTNTFVNYSALKLLDGWFSTNASFRFGNNLFPDKTTNLQQKPFTIGAFTYSPYVVLGSSYFKSHGIDIRLTQEFLQRHNATPNLKVSKTENWGVQYSNESKPTDLLAELVYNDVDIILGGYIYIYYSYHYVDFTKAHYSSRLSALVPKPRMLSEIPLPLYPFTASVWALIFSSLVISAIALHLAKNLRDFADRDDKSHNMFGRIILKVYSIYLQQPNYSPKITVKNKKIVIWIFAESVFISMVFNSGMSSLMVVPRYEKPITKLADFIDSNVKIGCTAIKDYLLLLVNSEIETDQKILSRFAEYNWTDIKHLTENGEIGALTEKTQSGNFAINGVTKSGLLQLQIMQDHLCFYHLLLCTKKNFALRHVLDKFIGRVVESGLTKFWENEAIYLHSNVTMQNIVRWSTNRDPVLRKLNVEQVSGAFIILFCGLFISALVFIYEFVLKSP